MRFRLERSLSCGALPLCERGRLTTYFQSWQALLPPAPQNLSLSLSLHVSPSSLSLVVQLYLCRILRDGRADTGCVASQTCSAVRLNGFQLCDLSPLHVRGSCLIWHRGSIRHTGKFNCRESNSPERKRFAHTVWLQSWCLCCVSINVSDYYLSF